MWEYQYFVYIWLQLGIEKYSPILDFVVYAVTVKPFIQCCVRVLSGLPVASEKHVSSYLSEKYFCCIPVLTVITCSELCTGQNGARNIPAEQRRSRFAHGTSWVHVTFKFYFHCLKTYLEQMNGHTITHSFHFSLQFWWHIVRQVTPYSPCYEI
jgi:hypothetical protein